MATKTYHHDASYTTAFSFKSHHSNDEKIIICLNNNVEKDDNQITV